MSSDELATGSSVEVVADDADEEPPLELLPLFEEHPASAQTTSAAAMMRGTTAE